MTVSVISPNISNTTFFLEYFNAFPCDTISTDFYAFKTLHPMSRAGISNRRHSLNDDCEDCLLQSKLKLIATDNYGFIDHSQVLDRKWLKSWKEKLCFSEFPEQNRSTQTLKLLLESQASYRSGLAPRKSGKVDVKEELCVKITEYADLPCL